MITEDAFETKWVGRVRDAVRDGMRIYLYDKKYEVLDNEEKYHLMCEDITKRICHAGFWG